MGNATRFVEKIRTHISCSTYFQNSYLLWDNV